MEAKQIELTGVFVQDAKGEGYTAFFAQLPNIIAEGDTEEDAAQNLINAVKAVFEHQKNEEIQQPNNCSGSMVKTKPFNLAFA